MGALIEIKELHLHVNLQEVSRDAKEILKTVNKIFNNMPTKAEFEAAFARQSAALQNIADDIRRLTEQQSQGGLSEADEQAILDQLNAAADQLEALAGQTPETPTEPEPTPEG